MNRIVTPKLLVLALLATGMLATARPAAAQLVIAPPPPVVIATTPPVYYEGHAAYWYGNRWVWRDGHGWHAYDREPGYLHDHRFDHRRPRYEHHRR
ncbi:MAG: hypothetical protein FWD17_04245 [Polyangiaceae bacterium]|nr:hypothetical protein [Polyangiaceae bacterium]